MPRIVLLGGPNGAGKTAAAMRILPDFLSLREYVNADTIAAAGLRVAIAEAVEEHRRAGRKVAIWRDGKVARVTVEEAREPDRSAG